jgi:hypothetical protein
MYADSASPLSPREMSSRNRSSAVSSGRPIISAHCRNCVPPMTAHITQPSRVRNTSDGPIVWPRLWVDVLSSPSIACSISVPEFHVSAVRSSAASMNWPSPVRRRWRRAARVEKAASVAVEKST